MLKQAKAPNSGCTLAGAVIRTAEAERTETTFAAFTDYFA
jgi:hypothetical protein